MVRILVVDPFRLDSMRARVALEAAGHAVVERTTLAEASVALSAVGRDAIDLVVTEHALPDGNAFDLLAAIHGQEGWRFPPVVVMAARPSRELVIDLCRAGAATVVAKPIHPEILLRQVTHVLAEREAQGPGRVTWGVQEFLHREIKRVERSGGALSVAVCRLPYSAPPSQIPVLIASLMSMVRTADVLARLGPQEILIILPDTDQAGAGAAAFRVRQAAASLVPDYQASGLAIGTATFPGDGHDPATLIQRARERLG